MIEPAYTPIQEIDGVFVKRDDLYCRAGICGGKVRACLHLATQTHTQNNQQLKPAKGLITASARKSPQAQIVARIAQELGIPARCHMPLGAYTDEMNDVEAHGGKIIQHQAGYNNVIISRAVQDCGKYPEWRYIPFGMQHPDAIVCTMGQVYHIPAGAKRIVVCLGSGMSAVGILWGLVSSELDIPVLGVRVGADPTKRINAYAPFGWKNRMQVVDATKKHSYHTAVNASIGGIRLDPHYEAKCLEYVEPGDLFWIVGIRPNA